MHCVLCGKMTEREAKGRDDSLTEKREALNGNQILARSTTVKYRGGGDRLTEKVELTRRPLVRWVVRNERLDEEIQDERERYENIR